MDETRIINQVELRGTIAASPQYSHESRGEKFFQFPMEIARLSGTVDQINVIVREQLLSNLELTESPKIAVLGELRSFNNKSGEGSRLVITVFARELFFDSGEDKNVVILTGTLCKLPTLRETPMGREICDIMLAVNRRYGRSDYLPCIAWGMQAKDAAECDVGAVIHLSGRIQSRNYIKNMDGIPVEKTAFEVSVMEFEKLEQEV